MVREASDRRRLFVNVVDDGLVATALLGGVVRRGGVSVAISTQGGAPTLAGLVREALEALVPEDLGAWLEVAGRERPGWKSSGIPHADRRPLLLTALNRIYGRASEVTG
jgi:siroheme synthase-like protein